MGRVLGLALATGVLTGVAGMVVLSAVDGVPTTAGYVATVAASAAVAMFVLTRPRLLPLIYFDQMRKLVGKGELPPPESVPARSPLATAWAAANNGGDWEAVRGMAAEGFKVEYPALGKTLARDRYLRVMRRQMRHFPGTRYTIEEIRAAGGELWVRATMRLPRRRGEPIVAEWWEAWRVDEPARRLLGIRQGRVLVVAP